MLIQTDLYSFSYKKGSVVPFCKKCGSDLIHRDEKTIKNLLRQKYKLKTWAGSYVKTLDEFIENPMNFQQELKQKEEKQ